MMVPNQIKMQNFSSAGRGAYKSSEVDAFMQRVYASYAELYSENAELKKKFASLRDIIEEYNAGKNAIATALVKAQTVADQTVESAKNASDAMLADAERKAKALIDEKTKDACEYAEKMKQTADEELEKAREEIQRLTGQANTEARKYIDEVNEKAKQILADANAKAAQIVARAFSDAKKAQDRKNELIADAKDEYMTVKDEVTEFKKGALSLMKNLLPKLEALKIPDFVFESGQEEELVVPEPVEPESDSLERTLRFEDIDLSAKENEKPGESLLDEEPVVKEKKTEPAPKKAYIPSADEYVKHIFDSIDLPKSGAGKAVPADEKKKPAPGVGYNGNKTSFSVSEDFDLFSDDD